MLFWKPNTLISNDNLSYNNKSHFHKTFSKITLNNSSQQPSSQTKINISNSTKINLTSKKTLFL